MNERVVLEKLGLMQEAILKQLRLEVREHIKFEMGSYRQSISVRESWCCKQFQKFAVETWSISSPKNDPNRFGTTVLALRGEVVNYCPFCGVHVGTKEKG